MIELDCTLSATDVARDYARDADALQRCKRHTRTFDASLYRPKTLERAQAMWSFRMESEHRSASVFAALSIQMMEAGAPLDMEGTAMRMALDELRHAEACAELVSALGGVRARQVKEPIAELARHPGCTPEERVVRNVLYGCTLSETVNCARFAHALDTVKDPLVLDVVRQLLSDEAKHAQLGAQYLEARASWLAAETRIRDRLVDFLRYGFAVLERDMAGGPAPKVTLEEDERAIGLLDPNEQREIFYVTVVGAIVPLLERFEIDAGRAWRERRLS